MSNQKIEPTEVTGIILSGGSSSRFQQSQTPWQDKALVPLPSNETLLEKTISVLAAVCSKIIIQVNDTDRKLLYQSIIKNVIKKYKTPIELIVDDPQHICSGPSHGLISAIPIITTKFAIVLPVDMPNITSNLLQTLLTESDNYTIVVPYWQLTGKIEPLVFSFNVHEIRKIADILKYISRSRADDLFRLAPCIKFLSIAHSEKNEFEVMFSSLNQRDDSPIVDLQIRVTKEIFDLTSLKVLKRPIITQLVLDTQKLLEENLFIATSDKAIQSINELSNKLLEQGMYFYAGLLTRMFLDNTISSKKAYTDLLEISLNSFLEEAAFWEKSAINFLALHAYSDAYQLLEEDSDNRKEEIKQKIKDLKMRMNLPKKNHHFTSFTDMFKQIAPNFLSKAKKLIQESEAEFNRSTGGLTTDFLWDHSFRVGKIAHHISILEGVDPLIPSVAAILHDAGKFVLGKYHKDQIPEEVHSVEIARKILKEEGFSEEDIEKVAEAIYALYNEKLLCSQNCEIVHDADRLEKLGTFGVANFFTKMTLRGVNLSQAILRSLSRELTYISAAPRTMLTESGRRLASNRSPKAIAFFKDLLAEMKTFDLGKFFIRDFKPKKNAKVHLVIPEHCPKCLGGYTIDLSTETGIKCEKLKANYHCLKCEHNYTIEFCLPLT